MFSASDCSQLATVLTSTGVPFVAEHVHRSCPRLNCIITLLARRTIYIPETVQTESKTEGRRSELNQIETDIISHILSHIIPHIISHIISHLISSHIIL